jgi:hypothetical protein
MVQMAASMPRRPRRYVVARQVLPKRLEAAGSDCMFFPCRRIWILFLSLETGFLSHNIVPLNKNFEVYFVRDMRHRQAAPDKACGMVSASSNHLARVMFPAEHY